ncbi:hypothetical protein FXF51_20120 [Nonomuraea sp. PA05]|uniref:hypothetical protein n=1 Tax=Nonomuraea sp. PA05 TaxID=2604466 RepID=UPI0011D856E0|nr:hypothetical protein [Nonomuraea sp. PA05]TYB64768.1 hypothetical protein FXF51_20120 [Nonomuraea sp. PA05]
MKVKNTLRATAVALTLAVAGTALAAQPASASTKIYYMSTQGEYDNNPGNGAQAWVWVWSNGAAGGRIVWEHYDGTGGTMYVGHGVSASRNVSKDIWRARVCEHYSGTYSCSPWY